MLIIEKIIDDELYITPCTCTVELRSLQNKSFDEQLLYKANMTDDKKLDRTDIKINFFIIFTIK